MPAVTITDTRTYRTMQDRIADELKRSNIANQIASAIQDAVLFYQQEAFFFTENTDSSTTTVQGTNLYAFPSDLIRPIDLTLTIPNAGLVYPLNLRDLDWILVRDEAINPVQEGQPTDYCIFQNQARLWPTPDAQGPYTLNWYYDAVIPAPVNDTDGGFWVTGSQELMVRAYAKGLLYDQLLKANDKAQIEFAISDRAYKQVKKQTAGKLFTGETAAPRF